ncbi:MAG: hypothetical protein AAB340_00885 [Patescibacteria group bacterium]
MKLRLVWDDYEGTYDIRLSSTGDPKAPNGEDSYTAPWGLLENIVKRLRHFPSSMDVSVDFRDKTVRFHSFKEDEQLTTVELLLISEKECDNLRSVDDIREYKQSHFPSGKKMSVAESCERFPWMKGRLSKDVKDITLHEVTLAEGQELTGELVNYQRRRNNTFFCKLLNNNGEKLGDADSDCWVASRSVSEDLPWEAILKQVDYLMMSDTAGIFLYVIHRNSAVMA